MRVLEVEARPSERLLRACAAFGIGVRRAQCKAPCADAALVRQVRAALRPGRIVLVLGPSGAGKSTLLRAIARKPLAERGGTRGGTRTIIDAMPGSVGAALRALASAGLGDAMLLGRCAAELSEGERSRYTLARAFASRRRVLVIDEFASVLDRANARRVARSLRRWTTRTGTAVLCATAHDDIEEWLGADVTVRMGGARVSPWAGCPVPPGGGRTRS